MIKNFLLVAFGAGLGGSMRYAISLLFKQHSFPFGTLVINIAGSFILGVLVALHLKNNNINEGYLLFAGTGICGGFTTFSAFSYENVSLLQSGKYDLAFCYILASVVAGITTAWLGFKLINP